MKIGIVCYPTYGGSGVLATELGIAMAEKGHEVHFITYRTPVRLAGYHANVFFHEVEGDSYPLFEYAPYDTALASKMVDIASFYSLDLFHVHYAIPHAAVAFLARNILKNKGLHVPFITTLHGTDITLVGTNKSFKPVVEFTINASDGVTVVSESLKQDTLNSFDIQRDIKVIHNFVDFRRFRKTDKNHFKKAIAPNGEKLLIHTSNFRKLKRVQDVINIFQIIAKEVPSKLLLIGDGPDRQRVEEYCRDVCQCIDVRFLGRQDAVEELLAVADLFIMPSAAESFGLAALEAMACEVPVISTNIGGIPEVNIHGQTGFLSDVGDVEDMAKNALILLKDEEKLNQFKQNALVQAKKFDITKILPAYEAYYQEILSKV